MLKRIIILFLFLAAIALLFAWLVRGGPSSFVQKVKEAFTFESLSSGSGGGRGSFFSLPWKPEFPMVSIGPDGTISNVPGYSEHAALNDAYGDVSDEYRDLEKRAEEAKVFGTPSPYAKAVYISNASRSAQNESPSSEYISIAAAYGNSKPIAVTGWSLQSVISGVRVYIPSGVSPFLLGSLNTASPIQLEPGVSAIVMTGSSPTGVSFRENKCSGYLEQFQAFTPSLSQNCPSPGQEMPLNASNLSAYGATCVDFVQSLPACRFYTGFLPQGATPACNAFIGERISYNGCVKEHRIDSDFFENVWRVYLDSPAELWRNSHDVIRLLDAEGRTVDVLTY